MKQPVLGMAALVVAIVLSMTIISRFEEQTFSGIVAFLMMSMVPTLLVMTMVWQTNYPSFLKDMQQPVKGIAMTAITVAIGSAVAAFSYFIVGQGHGITPILTMFTIFTIAITFWYVAMWRCWPVANFTNNPLIIGGSVYVMAYGLGYALFSVLFDFSFLAGTPVYFEDIDPKGIFMAWDVLIFIVSTVAAIMLIPLFDGWPVRNIKNPTLNIIACSLLVVIIGGAVFKFCTTYMAMDQIKYLVRVPVAFLFGTFLPLSFFQGKLLQNMPQPFKGIALTLFCAAAALVLQNIYLYMGPILSGELISGPKGNYQQELWLASALLGLTFPVVVIMLDYFQFWPLVQSKRDATEEIESKNKA